MFAGLFNVATGQLYIGDMLFYAISFLILMALVSKFAWKPVVKTMNDRAKKIADDIDNAENSRSEAQKLADQRATELKQTRQEAAGVINDAKQNGETQRTSIINQAQTDAQTLKENAQKDIEQARQNALASVQNDVANISIEIASKVIKRQLSADDQADLIDSYIKELGKNEA